MSRQSFSGTTFATLEGILRAALAAELPGAEAHVRMAPQPRPGWRAGEVPEASRDAAALLCLYPKDGEPHLVLTVRAVLPHHSGQVSLPGGAREPGETIEQAAVREAAEEIGVDPGSLRLVGGLTPLHIPVSGFTLHPVVAVSYARPDFLGAASEVARIIEVPLDSLTNGRSLRCTRAVRDGVEFDMPYFDLDGEVVWGATAMVLSEFLWVLGVRLDPWRL